MRCTASDVFKGADAFSFKASDIFKAQDGKTTETNHSNEATVSITMIPAETSAAEPEP